MAWFSGLGEAVESGRLASELSALRGELALIQRKLARRGRSGLSNAQEQGGEFYEELRERLASALPLAQRQAQAAERFARANPAAVVVGAAVVGLLLTLALRKR